MTTNAYRNAAGLVYSAATPQNAADQQMPVVAADHLANLNATPQVEEVVKKVTLAARKVTYF